VEGRAVSTTPASGLASEAAAEGNGMAMLVALRATSVEGESPRMASRPMTRAAIAAPATTSQRRRGARFSGIMGPDALMGVPLSVRAPVRAAGG